MLAAAVFSAAVPKEAEITVRGTMQRAAGIGGETTGWMLRLDAPLHVEGKELNLIEVEAKLGQPDKFEDKYVEATGSIAVKTGVERGSWPVLKIRYLNRAPMTGTSELESGYVRMTLRIEPAQIVWKKLTGKPKPEYPVMTLSVMSSADVVLKFEKSTQVCYAVRNIATQELTWKHPAEPVSVSSELVLKRDGAMIRVAEMPQDAAPAPGTYALHMSFCGYDEYSVTTRFVVREN